MTLKTRLISAAVMLAASTVLAGAQDRVVNVYNWSDYIDESILTEFTAETGIKVVYDVFDSNEVLETKLLAGSTGYDIVVPTGTFLANQIKAGVFQKLDKSKLTNIANMDPAISERLEKYDPGNEYAINYMWGTTGLGINVDMVKERLGDDAELNTWDLVFDKETVAKLADCGIFMLDAPTEMVPAALNYMGMDPDLKDQESIDKAKDLCSAVAPLSASTTPRNTSMRWPMATSAWPSAGRVTSCRRVTVRPKPMPASPSNTPSRRKAH
jgi:putrescine transport system substrate-binding protein